METASLQKLIPQADLDLVVRWISYEVTRLQDVVNTIEKTETYFDEYVQESMLRSELAIRQIRKFIKDN